MSNSMQWTIRNTFLEVVVPEKGEKTVYRVKRSSSDSSLRSRVHQDISTSEFTQGLADIAPPGQFEHARLDTNGSSNSTKASSECDCISIKMPTSLTHVPTSAIPRFEEDNTWIDFYNNWMDMVEALEFYNDLPLKDSRQLLFSSSSESKEAASENTIQNDSSQEDNVIDATKPGASSEDRKQNDSLDEDDVVDATKPIMYSKDFLLDEAMQVYQKISALVEKGADMRDALSTNLAGVDITPYIPVNPSTGQPTSLGSVHHLVGSCKPCKFLLSQRCRKGVTCLHCHFDHPESVTASPNRPSKKNRLRIQMKRDRKMVKQSEKQCDQQILVPDGQDGEAIIDSERKSCQTDLYQPGTRISF